MRAQGALTGAFFGKGIEALGNLSKQIPLFIADRSKIQDAYPAP
ncbi:MAG: hypothetical protein ACYCY5_04935 [Sulfuricella sp.]